MINWVAWFEEENRTLYAHVHECIKHIFCTVKLLKFSYFAKSYFTARKHAKYCDQRVCKFVCMLMLVYLSACTCVSSTGYLIHATSTNKGLHHFVRATLYTSTVAWSYFSCATLYYARAWCWHRRHFVSSFLPCNAIHRKAWSCYRMSPVYPSVCDVGGSWPHRWKILETNCANN